MKKYSQFQKIIATLMIFLLLIQLSGCYSTKVISSSTLPLPNSSKYPYIIHGQNTKYLLENTVISNGILSGKIDTMEDYRQIKNKIHIYIKSHSVIKISTKKILSIPLDSIEKVEMAKVDVVVIVILVAVCTLGIFALVSIVKMNSGSFLNIHKI
jgi:hypothetical protein